MIVAFWLLRMLRAAMAVNVEVVTPAATVTEDGIKSRTLLLDRPSVEPPEGAG